MNRKKYDEWYSTLFKGKPEWYWHFGLHDAKICNVIERPTELNLLLDTDSTCSNDIRAITFFNYSVIQGDLSALTGQWWFEDMLNTQHNKYLLKIETRNSKDKSFFTEIAFTDVNVEKKHN